MRRKAATWLWRHAPSLSQSVVKTSSLVVVCREPLVVTGCCASAGSLSPTPYGSNITNMHHTARRFAFVRGHAAPTAALTAFASNCCFPRVARFCQHMVVAAVRHSPQARPTSHATVVSTGPPALTCLWLPTHSWSSRSSLAKTDVGCHGRQQHNNM